MKNLKDKMIMKTITQLRKEWQQEYKKSFMTKEEVSEVIYGSKRNHKWMFSDC